MKTLEYNWEFGKEELFIKVDAYSNGDNLYIGLYHMEEGEVESFGDLTVNLPFGITEMNEAFIDDFSAKDKIAFIKQHNLGTVLPEKGYSGFCTYEKVAFDLERLAEFDKKGVEKYKQLYGIENKTKKSEKKKGIER